MPREKELKMTDVSIETRHLKAKSAITIKGEEEIALVFPDAESLDAFADVILDLLERLAPPYNSILP